MRLALFVAIALSLATIPLPALALGDKATNWKAST
jgi:hypothetical protein